MIATVNFIVSDCSPPMLHKQPQLKTTVNIKRNVPIRMKKVIRFIIMECEYDFVTQYARNSSVTLLKMKSTPEFNKFWKRKKKNPYRTVQKLWKSDKKEGSYDILKYHIFSENTSWPVLMNIQMSELTMSSPHNFLFISYTEMTKISYFSYENIKLAL